MFQASLSCGNLLLSTSPDGRRGEKMTVMKMLREGRTLMAIATLMYAPVPLEEVSTIVIIMLFEQLVNKNFLLLNLDFW